MSVIEFYVESPEEQEAERLYNLGYDDGYYGRGQRMIDHNYLEGYDDGVRESETSYDDTYDGYYDDDDDEDYDY